MSYKSKYTIEDVKQYLNEYLPDYQLISTEYINTNEKLDFKCNKEHIFAMSFGCIKGGQRCPLCHEERKKSLYNFKYEEVEEYIESFGYKLLSSNYQNAHIKLDLQCPMDHIFSMTLNDFKYKKARCPVCYKNTFHPHPNGRIKYEDFKKVVDEANLIMISLRDDYKDKGTKLKIKCPICGCEFEKNWDALVSSPKCPECSKHQRAENQKYTYEEVVSEFLLHNLIVVDKEYYGNQIPINFKCNKHPELGTQNTTLNSLKFKNIGCRACGRERLIEKLSGENSYLWQGGISSLAAYLRNSITPWKKSSMEFCNYKCVLTNNKFNDIHHLYGFRLIIKEVLEQLKLPIYEIINEYSSNSLQLLESAVISKHYEYPLGVCLCGQLHDLFHAIYTNRNNTPQQFQSFITRLQTGEFNDFLEEKNLVLDIQYDKLNNLFLNIPHLQEVS